MTTYEKSFKEEAVRLSDEIGVKLAASQLGIPYWTLADWRAARRARGSQAFIGSGHRLLARWDAAKHELLARSNSGSGGAEIAGSHRRYLKKVVRQTMASTVDGASQ